WKSAAPICRSASIDRASACTACVTRSAHFCTRPASSSTASTSRSWRASCPAVAAPNRPSPMTSTGASAAIFSTNDRPLLSPPEQLTSRARREGGGERDGAETTEEHGRREHVLGGVGGRRRESGREPAR